VSALQTQEKCARVPPPEPKLKKPPDQSCKSGMKRGLINQSFSRNGVSNTGGIQPKSTENCATLIDIVSVFPDLATRSQTIAFLREQTEAGFGPDGRINQ